MKINTALILMCWLWKEIKSLNIRQAKTTFKN